jgi:hypothetical protein
MYICEYMCIYYVYMMLCIEGTAAVVRGDIERKGMPFEYIYIHVYLYIYIYVYIYIHI